MKVGGLIIVMNNMEVVGVFDKSNFSGVIGVKVDWRGFKWNKGKVIR